MPTAAKCPRCSTGVGVPYRAAPNETPYTVRLLLRCENCRHRWSILTESAAIDGDSISGMKS